MKKKYHVKILIWDPCRFVLLGKEIFLGSMGNLRNKPKVLPWIAWYFNMAHRAMIWWFIFSPVGHPPVKKQPPKGPSLDSAPKVHKSSILYKEFNKEKKSYENIDLGSMPLCSFGKRNLPGKYGEPLETNQRSHHRRFYHGYPEILTWPTVPWFGDSSFHLLVTHGNPGVGAGWGMSTFHIGCMRCGCYATPGLGVGWGMLTFHVICMRCGCYAILGLGVGWGMLTFHVICMRCGCYAILGLGQGGAC